MVAALGPPSHLATYYIAPMRFREPFNTWSHLVGLVLAAVGTGLLVARADTPSRLLAFVVYGGSLILLYGTSTLYHGLHLPPRQLRSLRTLDHIAIYFLIAGTYTPVALLTLGDAGGRALLAACWGIAAVGIPFKIRWLDAPVWLSTAIYLAMGYLALLAVVPIGRAVGPGGLAWLIAGGVAYTIGAVIFALERPNPRPGFGHHEIWHLLVLLGSGCHFGFVLFHVAMA
jgi:hemolysin III